MFLTEIDKLRLPGEPPVFPEGGLPPSPPQPTARTAVMTTVLSAAMKRERAKNPAVVSDCAVNIPTPCFFMHRRCDFQHITSKKRYISFLLNANRLSSKIAQMPGRPGSRCAIGPRIGKVRPTDARPRSRRESLR